MDLLCYIETYSLARINLARAEETSGLETDAEVQKTRKRKPRDFSDHDSDIEPDFRDQEIALPKPDVPVGLTFKPING